MAYERKRSKLRNTSIEVEFASTPLTPAWPPLTSQVVSVILQRPSMFEQSPKTPIISPLIAVEF